MNLSTNEPKRIAIYTRTSPSSGDSQNHSTDNQIAIIKESLDRQGMNYVITGVFSDEHVSGDVRFDQRPAGKELLHHARNQDCDSIAFWELSRFYRDAPYAVLQAREFKQLGISLTFVGMDIDTSTAEGEMMLSIMGSMAAKELENTRRRVKEGLARAKARGVQLGGKRTDEQYVEAGKSSKARADAHARSIAGEFIMLVYQMHVEGFPFSLKRAALYLNERETPTSQGARSVARQRHGKPAEWKGTSVKRLMDRLSDLGLWDNDLLVAETARERSLSEWRAHLGLNS